MVRSTSLTQENRWAISGLRRPVLLVSAQPWLESNPPVITVIPVTRTRREQPPMSRSMLTHPGCVRPAAPSVMTSDRYRPGNASADLARSMGSRDQVEATLRPMLGL